VGNVADLNGFDPDASFVSPLSISSGHADRFHSATSPNQGLSGLNMFTFGNVGETVQVTGIRMIHVRRKYGTRRYNPKILMLGRGVLAILRRDAVRNLQSQEKVGIPDAAPIHRKRPAALPPGLAPWWKTILLSPDKLVIEQNGLDYAEMPCATYNRKKK
jgi:hypothetical protein